MHTSIDQVIAQINDEFASDLTAEQLAAKYAVDAATDMGQEGSGFSFEELEPHFDMLVESGAEFDFSKAMEIAQSK